MDHYSVAHTRRIGRMGMQTITMICNRAVPVKRIRKKVRRRIKRASHLERVGSAFCGVMFLYGILILLGPLHKYMF